MLNAKEFFERSRAGQRDFTGCELSGINLELLHLQGIKLDLANLQGACLRRARLLGISLCGANLMDADLRGVELRWAELRGADLRGANLSGSERTFPNWNSLRQIMIMHRMADLGFVDFRGADLSGADLTLAHLRGADLREANLSGANMRYTDLIGAKMTSEQLAQAASLEGAILPDGTKYTGTKYVPRSPGPEQADDAEKPAPNAELRAARTGADLTLKALAAQVGVSESTVRRWEREGTIPRSAEVRAKVAELLGVDPWAEENEEAER